MVWARQYLGKNWSGNVVLQDEHTITKGGPYQFVRHPIYAGGLFAMLGSALMIGEIFGLVWVLFCAFGLIRKARQEEELLTGKFPAEYRLYKQQTKMLIPLIW
jgi:protein-S-isoprenylcysteine O-methyltransferase Ste14